MKSIIRRITPTPVFNYLKLIKRQIKNKHNLKKSTEEVFTNIYKNNKWGGEKGDFNSGAGSTNDELVATYNSMVKEQAEFEGFTDKTFIDLGCGDFRVGSKITPLCSSYIGVDIVKPLIDRNQEAYGNETTQFIHLNIITDNLPDGDVCFVRQVFQHLSNDHISEVLKKLNKYKWVIITEHYPNDNDAIIENLDKAHGGDIRIHDNSGVYLDKKPFSLPTESLKQVMDFKWLAEPQGVIRTFLYKPKTHD